MKENLANDQAEAVRKMDKRERRNTVTLEQLSITNILVKPGKEEQDGRKENVSSESGGENEKEETMNANEGKAMMAGSST